MLFAIIGGAVIIVGAWLLFCDPELFLRVASYFRKVHKVSETSSCKEILGCRHFDKQKPRNDFSKEESRAIPNQRLVDAFGINNAFTTSDSEYRETFKRFAAKKIKLNDEEWKRVADLTLELVQIRTERLEHTDGAIPLVPFVQSVTLTMSFYVLFRLEPLYLKEKNVTNIAQLINELWIASKGLYFKPSLTRRKERLQEALRKIDRTFDFTPKRNPLNLILPAYETMWRVVLRCFLEVVFRNSGTASKSREVLAAYLGSPTSSKFNERPVDVDAGSASHIVNEALRLYPPTSRVYRHFKLNGWKKAFAADIESCQRKTGTWTIDGTLFEPSRWTKTAEDVRPALMSFGDSPFVCPAKGEFGPQMIGILVAALTVEISAERWTVGDNDKSRVGFPFSENQPLKSGREEFRSLKLWRKDA